MKKAKLHILVTVTLVFAAFTLGLLLGRSSCRGSITLSVPAAMETAPVPSSDETQETSDSALDVVFPIDLNEAGADELMALPGIGQVLTQRILDFRDQNGPFKAVEELMLIEGIGEKKLEQIIGKISIGG